MAAEGSTTSMVTALATNLVIAVSEFHARGAARDPSARLRLGPHELLIAGEIGVAADDDGSDIAAATDDVEAWVSAHRPPRW